MKHHTLRRLLFVLCASIGFGSCDRILLPSEPSRDPISIFDQFWTEFDQRYANFPDRNINWDSLRARYRPRLTSSTPDSTLGLILDSLIVPLHDAHVSLGTNVGWFESSDLADSVRPAHIDPISEFYLRSTGSASPSGNLEYGRIHDTIGYIRITTFETDANTTGWENEIDGVLDQLKNVRSLILDVRENKGGSAAVESAIAGRFSNATHIFAYQQARSGLAHNALSAPAATQTSPAGPFQFTKRIVLLTNRLTISAGEWFTLDMKTLPYVTTVGDTTAGCFSGRLDRELSNGWTYSLSFEHVTDRNHICWEGRGLAPDVEVYVKRLQSVHSPDTVLDRALQLVEH